MSQPEIGRPSVLAPVSLRQQSPKTLFVAEGDPNFDWALQSDEWNALSLNYTSGTTGSPKGVVYHHRGGVLGCYAAALATGTPNDQLLGVS